MSDRTLRVLVLLVLASAPALFGAGAQKAAWPAARARHHMVYDPASSQVLLLGGAQPRRADGAGPDQMLWSWDGAVWRPHSSALPRRANEAVAYDPDRRRLVVHGGSHVDETWEWDHRTWKALGAKGPGPRGHHAMTYDAARKHIVLFGNNDRTPTTDTWAWNGRTWERLAAEGPSPRGVFASAFDAKRGKVVIFGGCCAEGVGLVGDTWEWDGRRWMQIVTAAAPPARLDSRMAYDPVRDRIVLFGGGDRRTNFADTWEYDGRGWTRLDVEGPSPRNGHALVYDPRTRAVLLFGGRNEPDYLDDFWAFDGAWRRIGAATR